MYKIKIYATKTGKQPFTQWLENMADKQIINKIHQRLTLFSKGFLSDVKHLEDGVFETRIHAGGGIRMYFYMHGNTLIVLLCGGLKRTQRKDIAKALEYAEDFKERIYE